MESYLRKTLPNMKQISVNETTGEIIMQHKNGEWVAFVVDGKKPVNVLSSPFIKSRLKYFNDNGTMEAYK